MSLISLNRLHVNAEQDSPAGEKACNSIDIILLGLVDNYSFIALLLGMARGPYFLSMPFWGLNLFPEYYLYLSKSYHREYADRLCPHKISFYMNPNLVRG